MSNNHNINLSKFISTVLLLSILFVNSCSTNETITGNPNQSISKTADKLDINNFYSDDDEYDFFEAMEYIFNSLSEQQQKICIFFLPGVIQFPIPPIKVDEQQKAYDFRDNYLSKSAKGKGYILAYHILCNYGLENNLLLEYPLEHIAIMETGIKVSSELHNGKNDNKTLINISTYDDLKNLSKIYRNSENHKEINPVLDYLEADLEHYYNKTVAEVRLDFQ